MSQPGYHNRQITICSKIRSLLIALANEPSKYDQIAPKIEYWIEYVLREDFATVDQLVEGVSGVAWEGTSGSYSSVGRFLKEFYDAPHHSEQAKSFVSQLCPYVLRRFAIGSTEDLVNSAYAKRWVSNSIGGFISAASFVGHLIEWKLLSHELVQRHLTKSLTNHHDDDNRDPKTPGATRAFAIYNLLTAAGDTLLQGLLEPNDVRACFDILDAWPQQIMGFDGEKLEVQYAARADVSRRSLTCEQELHEIHAAWIQRKAEQSDPREIEEHRGGIEEDPPATEISAEVKTPVAFVPQDLPVATIGIEIPSSILQDIEPSSVFSGGDPSLDTFISIPSGAISPTLSISTVSDLTPTELGEEIDYNEKQTAARHDTLYFEDGNVEIACGDTLFRVHSSVLSLSSSKLREIVAQPALVDAPTPEGHPRVTVSDSAEDFTILLKTIYTPWLASPSLCSDHAS